MCDMDPEDPKDPVVELLLAQTIPGYLDCPATCHHRCDCECHRNKDIRHVMACCTGCGHGHSQILDVYLHAHLKACHGIEHP